MQLQHVVVKATDIITDVTHQTHVRILLMSHRRLLDNQCHILRMESHLSASKPTAADLTSATSLSAMLRSLTLAEHLVSRNIWLKTTTQQEKMGSTSDEDKQ